MLRNMLPVSISLVICLLCATVNLHVTLSSLSHILKYIAVVPSFYMMIRAVAIYVPDVTFI